MSYAGHVDRDLLASIALPRYRLGIGIDARGETAVVAGAGGVLLWEVASLCRGKVPPCAPASKLR